MKLFVELLSARPNESPHLRINLNLFKYILQDHPTIILSPFATQEIIQWYEKEAPQLKGHSQWNPLQVASFWTNPYLRIVFNMTLVPYLFLKHNIDIAIWSTPGIVQTTRQTHQVQRLSNLLPIVDPKSYRNPLQRLFNFVAARAACKKCSLVIANTRFTRDLIIKSTGVPDSKIVIIPEAPDENILETLLPLRFPYEKTVDVLIPSGLYWHKNISLGLKAARLASKLMNRKISVLIQGGRHPAYHEHLLKEFAAEFASGQFVYAGKVPKEEVWKAIASARVLLYPSRYESFGIPPLEGMTLGTPVLLSKIPSHIEVCQDAAVFHEPNSSEDAAKKLTEIFAGADDQIQRQFKHVANFSWREITHQTVAHLANLKTRKP